jgi:hypothetical protein
MTSKDIAHFMFAAVLLSIPAMLRADLITDPSLIPSPSLAIDFSQFAGTNTQVTNTPVEVGSEVGVDVTVTSNNPDGSYLGSGPYSFGDNGTWDSALALAGVDVDFFGGDQYSMIFQFNSGPVSAVGGLFNYATFDGSGFSDFTITALGAGNTVLESYDINGLDPISTPGGVDQGEFLGIVDPTADIVAFEISNSAGAVTDLTFSSAGSAPGGAEVPEPKTTMVAAVGLLLLVLRRSSAGRFLKRS